MCTHTNERLTLVSVWAITQRLQDGLAVELVDPLDLLKLGPVLHPLGARILLMSSCCTVTMSFHFFRPTTPYRLGAVGFWCSHVIPLSGGVGTWSHDVARP